MISHSGENEETISVTNTTATTNNNNNYINKMLNCTLNGKQQHRIGFCPSAN